MEELFRLKETAQYLKISESELRKLIKQKEISFIEIGEKGSSRKIKIFRESDILNYLQRNLQGRELE